MAALDACASLPGAQAVLPGIGQRRVGVTFLYERSDEERERELIAFLAIDQPMEYRASTLIAACADRPRLAERYLIPLIIELEATWRDEVLESTLRSAHDVITRLGLNP